MGHPLIAGIDIGGTKTHLVAARGGVTVADRILPTDDWRVREVEADAAALAGLVRSLCGGAAPVSTAVGAHGCDTDAQCGTLRSALGHRLGGAVQVLNDAELMAPAAGRFGGIGVVVGTGSIAVARSPDGRMLAAGGWGWILGDEGSAPALVRDAARAVRGAIDRGTPDDALTGALMRAVGTDDPTALGRLLDATRSAVVWGRYASAVFAAADAGSPLAAGVIAGGARALAELVGVLIGRGADAASVVAGGGVIAEQPRLEHAFRAAMAELSPASDVVVLRDPPVLGALALAGRALGPAA